MKHKRYIPIVLFLCFVLVTVILVIRNEPTNPYAEVHLVYNSIYEYISKAFPSESSESDLRNSLVAKNDSLRIGEYYAKKSTTSFHKGDYKEAEAYSIHAINHFSKVEHSDKLIVDQLGRTAFAFARMNLNGKAIRYTQQLLEILGHSSPEIIGEDEYDNNRLLANTILLDLYVQMDLKKQATKYYDILQQYDIINNDGLRNREYILHTYINYEIMMGNNEKVLEYAKQFYHLTKKLDEQYGVDTVDAVFVNIALGNILNRNFKEAYQNLQRAEQFFLRIDDLTSLIYTYQVYGHYYEGLGNVEQARIYYNKSVSLARNQRLIELELESIDYLLKLPIDDDDLYYARYYELITSKRYTAEQQENLSALVDMSDQF
ncbi:MAG: hypothetical protein ACRC5C_06430, partial [Bacilli bacterium]